VSELDDEARKVAGGDTRAFRSIVLSTQDRMYRLALRMTGNADDARDVVQDAYIRAHRALSEARWKGESKVETWLYRIVLNAALNHRRSRGRREQLAPPGPAPASSPETDADVARLMAAVIELPADQRRALVLKELEGHTSAEIGALLGCSEGAVEQRLLRARAALRRRLNDE
jgi:RNA polymerase sigma-70 factor (ECF subfamily)